VELSQLHQRGGTRGNFLQLRTDARGGAANEIFPRFRLKKQQTTLQKIELQPASFDVVYFDAFAPNKQPELWTLEMLAKVHDAMKSDGVFVTYCAKGQLKRDLKDLGFRVETLAGPPGKKEMVRAVKV
jgi:tRNA U34 5-methylaminomethyl-2-thiouridine-forming methyltransferase MnmC